MSKHNITRRFTGKLGGFETKQERNFYKKALKAYVKGKERFIFGINPRTRKPQMYETPQKFEWL